MENESNTDEEKFGKGEFTIVLFAKVITLPVGDGGLMEVKKIY